jgi:hypothetical protein
MEGRDTEGREAQAVEILQTAIQSLNKAWEVLGAQGVAGLSSALLRAGCTEYCGSYDGCTGYCKTMGAARLGEDVINPQIQPQARAAGASREMRLPFTG